MINDDGRLQRGREEGWDPLEGLSEGLLMPV